MVKIDDKNLEKALDKNVEMPKTSPEQEIAFHQGALTTLINERNELIKMIGNAEAVMGSHIQRLEQLGVKIKKN